MYSRPSKSATVEPCPAHSSAANCPASDRFAVGDETSIHMLFVGVHGFADECMHLGLAHRLAADEIEITSGGSQNGLGRQTHNALLLLDPSGKGFSTSRSHGSDSAIRWNRPLTRPAAIVKSAA